MTTPNPMSASLDTTTLRGASAGAASVVQYSSRCATYNEAKHLASARRHDHSDAHAYAVYRIAEEGWYVATSGLPAATPTPA